MSKHTMINATAHTDLKRLVHLALASVAFGLLLSVAWVY